MVEDEPGAIACRVRLKVVPGSRANAVVGPLGDRLKVKVAAPPEDGKANAAVCALLAGVLGVSRRAVTIVAGQTHPEKTARVEGMTAAEVMARLAPG